MSGRISDQGEADGFSLAAAGGKLGSSWFSEYIKEKENRKVDVLR